MIKKIKHAAIIGAAVLALHMPASATTFDSEALDSFIGSATACIVGKVASIEYVTRSGLVFTKATVTVTDTAFGRTASEISVLVPGGQVPNTKFPIAQIVADAPILRSGQDLMLVLNSIPQDTAYAVAGLSSGAINILDNGAGPQVALAGNQGLITLADAIEDIQAIRDGENVIDAE